MDSRQSGRSRAPCRLTLEPGRLPHVTRVWAWKAIREPAARPTCRERHAGKSSRQQGAEFLEKPLGCSGVWGLPVAHEDGAVTWRFWSCKRQGSRQTQCRRDRRQTPSLPFPPLAFRIATWLETAIATLRLYVYRRSPAASPYPFGRVTNSASSPTLLWRPRVWGAKNTMETAGVDNEEDRNCPRDACVNGRLCRPL